MVLELLKTHMPKKKILDSFFTAYLKKKTLKMEHWTKYKR